MPFDYIIDPQQIEKNSFITIREQTDLSSFDNHQQQVVMRIVHSIGMPDVADNIRFSTAACEQGLTALKNKAHILCDVEMVKQGITKRMIQQPPLCFLNDPRTAELAKKTGETRSMAAVKFWREVLPGSVVVIGNAPTALFRLLENLEQLREADKEEYERVKPALVIGMPVGFIGAAESKQALWEEHKRLEIECITLMGNQGGSAVSSAACNALLRINRGEIY